MTDKSHSYQRLREAMAPDPSRWYYPGGPPRDAGWYGASNCACGHDVKWEYIILCEDDNRELIIGSTCIEKNIPALTQAGATRLVRQVIEASREHDKEMARLRRDAESEGVIPALYADFRRLRKWCFARRNELVREGYQARDMPKVFKWVEEVPAADRPSKEAAVVRRGYVKMWLSAAQAASGHQTVSPEPIPLPTQPQLLTQLTNATARALKNPHARNHRGARFALASNPALRDVLMQQQPGESDVVRSRSQATELADAAPPASEPSRAFDSPLAPEPEPSPAQVPSPALPELESSPAAESSPGGSSTADSSTAPETTSSAGEPALTPELEPPSEPSALHAESNGRGGDPTADRQSAPTQDTDESTQPTTVGQLASAFMRLLRNRRSPKVVYPPWSIGADRCLPDDDEILTDEVATLNKLRGMNWSDDVNEELASMLEREGAIRLVRAVDVVDQEDMLGVVLYLPFRESQRIAYRSTAEGYELDWNERWTDANLVLDILRPFGDTSCGFTFDGLIYSYFEDEYRNYYNDPPEFISCAVGRYETSEAHDLTRPSID